MVYWSFTILQVIIKIYVNQVPYNMVNQIQTQSVVLCVSYKGPTVKNLEYCVLRTLNKCKVSPLLYRCIRSAREVLGRPCRGVFTFLCRTSQPNFCWHYLTHILLDGWVPLQKYEHYYWLQVSRVSLQRNSLPSVSEKSWPGWTMYFGRYEKISLGF